MFLNRTCFTRRDEEIVIAVQRVSDGGAGVCVVTAMMAQPFTLTAEERISPAAVPPSRCCTRGCPHAATHPPDTVNIWLHFPSKQQLIKYLKRESFVLYQEKMLKKKNLRA